MRMIRPSQHGQLFFAVGLLACFCQMGACGGSDGLSPITLVTRTLDSLVVGGFEGRQPPNGIFAVRGVLRVGETLSANERLEVSVVVASGDSESVMLEREFCDSGTRVCTQVTVTTVSGHTIDDLAGIMNSYPARWWTRCVSLTCGGMRVFDGRLVDRLINDLRKNRAVATAERDQVYVLASGGFEDLATKLLATAAMDYASANKGDHIVQGAKADLITVKYKQPDGSTLTSSMTMP